MFKGLKNLLGVKADTDYFSLSPISFYTLKPRGLYKFFTNWGSDRIPANPSDEEAWFSYSLINFSDYFTRDWLTGLRAGNYKPLLYIQDMSDYWAQSFSQLSLCGALARIHTCEIRSRGAKTHMWHPLQHIHQTLPGHMKEILLFTLSCRHWAPAPLTGPPVWAWGVLPAHVMRWCSAHPWKPETNIFEVLY